jgi:hypothetical protein
MVDALSFGILAPIAFIERGAVTYTPGPNVDAMGSPKQESNTGRGHFGVPQSIPVPQTDYLARGIALTMGIGAVVAAASAVYGFVTSSRCRRYQASFHPGE